jgi:hypothetical protein
MSREQVRLNASERDSHAWKKVEAVLTERLAVQTGIATNHLMTEQERYTAAVRIHEIKQILKLAEPAKEKTAAAGE